MFLVGDDREAGAYLEKDFFVALRLPKHQFGALSHAQVYHHASVELSGRLPSKHNLLCALLITEVCQNAKTI